MKYRATPVLFVMMIMLTAVGFGSAGFAAEQDDVMIQTYRKAISIDPNDVIAHFNLGLGLYKLERYPEAKDVLSHCLEINRQDAHSHQQVDGPGNQILGIIYYNYSHDDSRAVDAFRQSLKFLPNDPDTYYALGLACQRMKNNAEALKAFDQAIQAGRNSDGDVYFQRGLVLAALEKEPEAVASYETALKLKPDLTAALENLALIYHRKDADDKAIDVLQRLVKRDPMNFNANYLLGLHYYRKKMYPEMVAAYTRAVAVKPDLSDAHYNLGMAYYFQTRFDKAIDELQKAVTLNPKDAEAYNLLGQAQTAAIETYLHQGSTHLAQAEYPEAIAELKQVFAIDPNNARAKSLLEDAQRLIREEFASHLRAADKFYRDGKLEDAFEEYDQASSLNPDSAEAQEGKRKTSAQLTKLLAQRMQKAKAAELAKDYQEAHNNYSSILELKPDYAPAKSGLQSLTQRLAQEIKGWMQQAGQFVEKENLNEALERYKKVLKWAEVIKDTDDQEKALAGLTRVNARKADLIHQYLAQGKKFMAGGAEPKAKEAFNAVLKLDPQNKAANEFIVKLTGTQSEAKVTDEQIKSTYYRGVDFYVNGKIEEAIQEWERVVKLDPENQDARINIARAKAKLAAIRKLTQGY